MSKKVITDRRLTKARSRVEKVNGVQRLERLTRRTSLVVFRCECESRAELYNNYSDQRGS